MVSDILLGLANTLIHLNQTKKFITVIPFGERCLKDVVRQILGLIDKTYEDCYVLIKIY